MSQTRKLEEEKGGLGQELQGSWARAEVGHFEGRHCEFFVSGRVCGKIDCCFVRVDGKCLESSSRRVVVLLLCWLCLGNQEPVVVGRGKIVEVT